MSLSSYSLPDQQYEFGAFRLDARERALWCEGKLVPLTPKLVETLLVLVERGGHIVDKQELMERVWPDTFVEEGNIARHVSLLRKTLGEWSDGAPLIETLPRRGYRFIAPVRKLARSETVETELVVETHAVTRVTAEESIREEAISSSSLPVVPSRSFARRPLVVLTILGVTALACFGLFLAFGHFRKVTGPPRISPATALVGNEFGPSFSPDGSQMAFVWNGPNEDNEDIYVKLSDTGAPLRLTTHPGKDQSPAWSPDGRSIAFMRDTGEVFLIPALGGVERRIGQMNCLQAPFNAQNLSWSPDNQTLAIEDAEKAQGRTAIVLLDVKTGAKRQLTTPRPGLTGDATPAFSPDGRTVAFARWITSSVGDLYLAPVNGGEPRQLTFDKKTIRGLAWNKDGGEILFASERRGLSALWRIPVDGGEPQPVEGLGYDIMYPALARTGKRLAYMQAINDTNIWRIDLTRTTGPPPAPTRLIASSLDDDSPQYSPDGKHIAFGSARTGATEIWLSDSDGTRLVQLTTIGGYLTGTPRWSPDSRWIAFDSRAGGNADIFIVDVEGGPPRRLTTEPSEEVVPSWSKDGRWLYFCSNRGGDRQIWKTPVAGGAPVQVTRQGGFEGFESFDGQFFYFTKDSRNAALWRMPVAGGVESKVAEEPAIFRRNWALTAQGFYFASEASPTRQPIEYFSFVTGKSVPVFTPARSLVSPTPGIAVSPDGHWLLYTQIDQRGSDIMLVENFE